MVNLFVKLCLEHGCTSAASFGLRSEGQKFCSKHRLEGMVNLRRRICVTKGCEITANYKLHCATHSPTPTHLRGVGGGDGGRSTKVRKIASRGPVQSAVASYLAGCRVGLPLEEHGNVSTAAAKHVPGFAPGGTEGELVLQPQGTAAASSSISEEPLAGWQSGGVRAQEQAMNESTLVSVFTFFVVTGPYVSSCNLV